MSWICIFAYSFVRRRALRWQRRADRLRWHIEHKHSSEQIAACREVFHWKPPTPEDQP